jgi:ribbon-helix-helix CopG family protein
MIPNGAAHGVQAGQPCRTNTLASDRESPFLNIDDKVMADLKREAARQGRTMSELVESALRLLLRAHRKRQKVVALPTFHSGGAVVDIADRAPSTKRWKGASARC